MNSFPHSFHIPVMGLAFTIDSPIKVARFGIPSVVSIIEDRLIEMMRKHYYGTINEKFKPITVHEPDYRAKRVTDYLNLLNKIINDQVEKLKTSTFQTGSDIVKYFEMLPSESKLKQLYTRMTETRNQDEKESLKIFLRSQIRAGSIDVNIMTKVDKNNYDNNGAELKDGSDAVAALRGYALSTLSNSSIIFSAGMNPRLYNYLDQFTDFDAVRWGEFKKSVVIKVSDYRSALIQGKVLAKKGIWVSEFRIESGLNCGGHAFATDGFLLGPILQEFKDKREELTSELHTLYSAAAKAKGKMIFEHPHPIRISVQGGIGTAAEDRMLRSFFKADSTGWGTPFLLCPEATTVDQDTLQLLQKADDTSLALSKNSPLGIRFHYLKGTTSDKERLKRIEDGKPGSPCTEKHLASNTEFTAEPICTASLKYQTLKLEQLKSLQLTDEVYEKKRQDVISKECLCVGLSNSASHVYNTTFLKKLPSVTICPGPNIKNFDRIATLQEMTDHIYGKANLLSNPQRPHMFINELDLYLAYFKELTEEHCSDPKQIQYALKFANNLLQGIAYYRSIREHIHDKSFSVALDEAESKLQKLTESIQETVGI